MKVFGLALAAVLVAVAPGAARPRGPEPILVSARGHCDSLRVGQRDATDVCNGRLFIVGTKDHVAFLFSSTAEDGKAVLLFGGRGPIVDVGEGKRVQAVGVVGFTFNEHVDPDVNAVGLCEYTDPYRGVARVACSAVVAGGRRFEGAFTTDGARPKRL